MITLKKTAMAALAAVTLAGTIAASSSPAAAQWRHRGGYGYGYGYGGPLAAGILGGAAIGAFAAPRYYSPYPAYGAYSGECYMQRRATHDRWGNFVGYRRVRVCD